MFRYFTFLTACHNPKACTILLRGPSKDIINEIERNLQDAMFVTRNIYFHPRLCPGGGATEMAIAVRLAEKAKIIPGVMAWPYKSVADAMEVIPRTLVQNCGANAVKVLTDLRVLPDLPSKLIDCRQNMLQENIRGALMGIQGRSWICKNMEFGNHRSLRLRVLKPLLKVLVCC